MSDLTGPEMPQWTRRETLAAYLVPLLDRHDVKWRGHGIIYVDYQRDNIHTLHQILTALSVEFGVSSQAVRVRLIELGWLRDIRRDRTAKHSVEHVVGSLLHKTSRGTDISYFEVDKTYD